MCEICKKHGGRETWYFNPRNYSREMGEKRKEFLEKIAGKHFEEWLVDGFETFEIINKVPFLRNLGKNLIERYEIDTHGGQIIPLEDALKVMELCENPSLLTCSCRKIIGDEKYCCINFGMIPELYKKANPNEYLEEITVSKAKNLLKYYNELGMYHLILWSKAPYVTTICNCTAMTCTGYKERVTTGAKTTLMKSEYVGIINQENCNGCKNCLIRCQFGSVRFNLDTQKAFIEIQKCFGCGICKTGCKNNAITMVERRFTPARDNW